nr:hypothetical protein [Luteibacter rhizovicinus]
MRRDAARASLANGVDPSASRQEAKRERALALTPAHTFSSVAELWMARLPQHSLCRSPHEREHNQRCVTPPRLYR